MIAADRPSLEGRVSERFARTEFFLIYDPETEELLAVENDPAGSSHGAGPKAVQIALDNGVSAIISAIPGENAMLAVREAGIGVYDGRGLVAREAVEILKKGDLKRV